MKETKPTGLPLGLVNYRPATDQHLDLDLGPFLDRCLSGCPLDLVFQANPTVATIALFARHARKLLKKALVAESAPARKCQ